MENFNNVYPSALILERINPPEKINSIEQMNSILDDESYLTLIERPFFNKIKQIIGGIVQEGIQGDIVFVGVYRGGGALYVKSLFEELGHKSKSWLFDSFNGFAKPETINKKNNAINLFTNKGKFREQPSIVEVSNLFNQFNLAENMEIVDGFVKDTLENHKIEKIAFLHIDVDLYDPTLLSLQKLYPALSEGGWVIIDDYSAEVFDCKEAVDLYRNKNKIQSPIISLGNYPVGWKK